MTARVALVTGAGRRRGIGHAIALELATDGADVVVHESPRPLESDNREQWQGAASVVEEIVALGRRAIAVRGDITDAGFVAEMTARATTELGPVEVLVNNAGTAGASGAHTILELDDATWYHTIDVNLNGTYLVTKAVAAGMLEHGRGAIVNIASLAGRMPFARFGSYGASKAGIVALTQQLALEFAPVIRVNCVCPGCTDTDMMDGTFRRREELAGVEPGRGRASAIRAIPLGRQGRPQDIAHAVAFLASERASWITGQTLNVDGGNRMD